MRVVTARRIVQSIRSNARLLDALHALRTAPEADRAVAAVLELRDLRILLASWELFDELTASDGGADAWLRRYAGTATVDAARVALYGDGVRPGT